MRRSRLVASVLALATGGIALAATLPPQEGMPQPTEQHKMVLSGVGEWEGTLTTTYPGMEASTVPARESIVAIGGFWTQARFECEFMGMPYVGTGFVGYDETKGKYVGTWVDSMSSHLSIMEGDYDKATKTTTMRWTAPDMTGQMAAHRFECVETAAGRTTTFYVGEGKGTKTMVIEMKRAAAPKKAMGGTR